MIVAIFWEELEPFFFHVDFRFEGIFFHESVILGFEGSFLGFWVIFGATFFCQTEDFLFPKFVPFAMDEGFVGCFEDGETGFNSSDGV